LKPHMHAPSNTHQRTHRNTLKYTRYNIHTYTYTHNTQNNITHTTHKTTHTHTTHTQKNKGVIVPALPEKSAVQKFQMSLDFIEQRRRALQARNGRRGGRGVQQCVYLGV